MASTKSAFDIVARSGGTNFQPPDIISDFLTPIPAVGGPLAFIFPCGSVIFSSV
jgi:hypothetical protein